MGSNFNCKLTKIRPTIFAASLYFILSFQVLIHIGLLANEGQLHFAEEAGKGGPLGELVQWSDLISSLYILGHDITVTASIQAVQRSVTFS